MSAFKVKDTFQLCRLYDLTISRSIFYSLRYRINGLSSRLTASRYGFVTLSRIGMNICSPPRGQIELTN